MSDPTPSTITLTEHGFALVRSTGADVRLSVSETSLGAWSSQRAAALRRRLADLGFGEGEVTLQGVDHTSWAWIALPFVFLAPLPIAFGTGDLRAALLAVAGFVLLYLVLRAVRLGTVTATLKVQCEAPARVGAVIDEALSCGAAIASIDFRYAAEEVAALTVQAIERANTRAARVAAALGISILGVHSYQEEQILPQPSVAPAPLAREAVASRARVGTVSDSLGPAPSATERAGVRVTVAYRVG